MTILVTGNAGFIGFHLAKRLIEEGIPVVGYDNINSYYDKNLKISRLKLLDELSRDLNKKYDFIESDLEDYDALIKVFERFRPTVVINLAAQAGVRYSIENPSSYVKSNILGFSNILESCKEYSVKHLIYASSSSVYGGNKKLPYSELHGVDHPVSMYAASKKANELMAHTYSHLYNLPTTGLRFFTVYGPWGRPDMALFLFTKAILNGEPIKIFNKGDMVRDFTYIDDIIESLFRLINKPASSDKNINYLYPNPSTSWAPYRVFNIGNSQPIPLMNFINEIELKLGIKAQKEFLPMQQGDVQSTSADTAELEKWVNFKPNTSVKEGISKFIDWYNSFYKQK
tara:strand:- start:32451 stop:33476 length:1026 start_codon:yes stop_codon:yes gene_type:complete